MFPELFYPIMIGSKMSRNRMSYEPMGNHFSELDGRVSARDVAFYGERARGGCGIIFTETCSVNSKNGRANTRNICLDRDEIIPTL
ncbi:MAG: NADH:flavin oxidoreductase, partial [Oscillospiraceae bacterium]|nr:NADH:flavin oxidoreductase [Oscillospiraceae bacterium]